MSSYQSFKLVLVELSGLPRGFFHLLVGVFVFFLAKKLFKIKKGSFLSIVPPFLFGIFLEIIDWRDAIVFNGPISILDTFGDIFLTVSLPIIFTFYERRKANEQ